MADELVGMRSRSTARRAAACSSAGEASAWTRVLDDPEVDPSAARRHRRPRRALRAARRRGPAIGVIVAHDKLARPIPASPTTTSGWRRPSRPARPSPSTSRSGSRATRCARGAPRSWSAAGSRASCTTRRAGPHASVLLGLKALEEADASASACGRAVRELVVATLQDVRRLAVELRPKALDDFGSCPALERLATASPSRRASRSTSRRGCAEDRLPSDVETALYRIVQEALTNVVKHAGRAVSVAPHARRASVAR